MTYNNTELKALSDEELVHAELQLDRDLIALRFRKNSNQLRDVMQIKQVRRNIARTRTDQRRREIEAQQAMNTLLEMHRASFKAAVTQSVEGSSFAADLNEQMEDGE